MPAAPAPRRQPCLLTPYRARAAAPGHRGRGSHPGAEPCRMAGSLPGSISPRWRSARLWCTAAVRCCRWPFRRRDFMCCGRGVCGQCAEGTLCAGATCSRPLQPVHELRAADLCRLPLHRVSSGREVGSPHGSGRLVLRDRGRLAAGRRQGCPAAVKTTIPRRCGCCKPQIYTHPGENRAFQA